VFKDPANMPDIRGQIEFLLIKIQMELDQVIMNEDALTLKATAELRAFVAREIDSLIAQARAGLSKDDVIIRLEGLRQEMGRRLELH
jgi:hypothetical protein